MSLLIAIDGTDASGKKTQTDMLYNKLVTLGYDVCELSFPDYDSPSSTLVKMYLGGEFGKKPDDVNPYAASTFFAVDRYASFKTKWENEYKKENKIILLNRYTTANAVHQLSKLSTDKERDEFLSWLWDLEFTKMGLPVPDLVFYLEMPPKVALSLLQSRCDKTGAKKDIHELDPGHLEKSHDAALYACKKWNWERIVCGDDKPFTRESIFEDIWERVNKELCSNEKI